MTDLTLVLLAAGRATRMQGADKMREPVPTAFGARPLLEVMAQRCQKVGPTRVVLGAGQEARMELLKDLNVDRLEVAQGKGMAASIAAGVRGLKGPALLVLADMPDITASDLHLMVALGAKAPDAILRAASEDGQPGHPVLFPADLLPELVKLTGDTGARSVLERHHARVNFVPLKGERALTDLDTPEAWRDWRRRQGDS